MTTNSGGPTINQGPAPGKDRDEVGEVAGNVGEKGQDPSPGDRERGDSLDPEDCTARDRAS